MAIKAQETQLNVVPGGIIPVVHVSQYDVGRTLTFILYDGNTAASLATGTAAVIEGTKPDGHGFQYSATVSGNEVTVNTTQQMTIITGTVDCKIVLTKGSQVIGTALFIMDVEKAGINDSTIVSDTELPLIINLATEQMLASEGYAKGTQNGTPVGGSSPYYHSNSKYYKEQAETSASNAATSESNAHESEISAAGSESRAFAESLKSEGYAVGKQNGTDVTSDSPYYENNAEFYATSAKASAQDAEAAEAVLDYYVDFVIPHFVIENNRLYIRDDATQEFIVANNRLYIKNGAA